MTEKVLWLAALALPLMLAGLWFGSRRFAGATPESFRRSILWLLMVIAAIGIAQGLWRLILAERGVHGLRRGPGDRCCLVATSPNAT